jgi:hypothetical protein
MAEGAYFRDDSGVSLLLVLFVTLSLSATLQKSPTADEGFHLVAGYSYLKWRDFRLNPEHPPLAKILAALPLLALDINDGPLSREQRDKVQANRLYGWLLANRWLFASTADPAYYGIDAVYKSGTWTTVMSTPDRRNDPGVSPYLAVSATHLTGVYLRPANPYAQFLLKEPVAIIGRSILIYRTD